MNEDLKESILYICVAIVACCGIMQTQSCGKESMRLDNQFQIKCIEARGSWENNRCLFIQK